MGNLLAGPVTPERVRVSLRLREMIRTWNQSQRLENEWIRKWWADQRRLEKPEGNWPLVSPPLKMLSPDSTSYRFGQCKHKHKYNPNTNTYQNEVVYLTLRRQLTCLVSYEVSVKKVEIKIQTSYKKHPDTNWQFFSSLFQMLMHIIKNAAKGKKSKQNR